MCVSCLPRPEARPLLFFTPTPCSYPGALLMGNRRIMGPCESPTVSLGITEEGASDRCLCVEQESPEGRCSLTPSSSLSSAQPLGAITSTCCRKEQCPCSPNKGSQLPNAKLTSDRVEVITCEGTHFTKNCFQSYICT